MTSRPYDQPVTATLEDTGVASISVIDPPEPPDPVGAVPAPLQPWKSSHRAQGWVLLAMVTVVAAVTRLWAIGWPPGKSFDEIYYATEAQQLLRYGYEDNRGYMFIVHPPVGKWFIAATSAIFGNNSVGWRVAPALAGIAAVVVMTRVARRMLRSELLGALAGLLLALDGVSVVQSRVALLDIFLQLFVLVGFAALVLDRDQVRGRLASLLAGGTDLSQAVPSLGPRPWRLVAGIAFGIACAVKWSGLSFWLGFALLSLLWDVGAFRSAGVERMWRQAARRSWAWAIGPLLVTPVATYLFGWTGWFAGENSWNRHWGDGKLFGPLAALVQYHIQAFKFHESLTSFHPYESNPWSWLILGRPVTFYYPQNPTGCGAATCSREILLIGTPVMWWGFLPALLWLAWRWLTRRDWRAGAVGMAMLAGWIVWFGNLHRTMFLFYMTPLVPFLVLALTMALGGVLGPAAPRGDRRRRIGAITVAVYLGLIIADFIWMWPLFTGGLLTYAQWQARMWFPSWV